MTTRTGQWLLTALFTIMIGMPLATGVITPDRTVAAQEKRALTQWPAPPRNLAEAGALPTALEAYYNDQFGLREALSGLYARAKVLWLGDSTRKDVLVGPDGWYFYTHTVADSSGLAYFDRRIPHIKERILKNRQAWLTKQGIRYLYVITPSKSTIYPERIPATYPHSGPSTADRLVHHLSGNTDVAVLDLRPVLRQARANGDAWLYSRTDSHWNDLGGYHGYRAIMERIAQWYPELAPLPRAEFEASIRQTEGGNLALQLGVGSMVRDEEIMVTPKAPRCAKKSAFTLPDKTPVPRHEQVFRMTCDSAPPIRLLMFRDSFSNALIPFLAEHFRESTYAWHASADQPITHTFPRMKWLVGLTRPDLVIEQIPERKLGQRDILHHEHAQEPLREQFENSPNTLLYTGKPGGTRIRPLGHAEAVYAGEDWRLLGNGEPGHFAIGPLRVDKGHIPLVRLEMEVPAPTNITIGIADTSRGSPPPPAGLALIPGTNRILVPLHFSSGDGVLGLSVEKDIPVTLKSLEVRAVAGT